MNKKQTRLFAIVSTALASIALLVLTIDSHRQFPQLTNAENITPAVSNGMDVWHKYNCINCHTLFGEGAYYAPDLTKITQHRGEQYLQAYMRDPAQFYDEKRHRRLMPKQDLEPKEITDLIAFLDWVSKVDNQGWPPRPILVTGASIPGTDLSTAQQAHTAGEGGETLPPGARPVSSGSDPRAPGRRWPGSGHARPRSSPRLATRAKPRTSKATSANRSGSRAAIWFRARCTRPGGRRSCRTPMPRT